MMLPISELIAGVTVMVAVKGAGSQLSVCLARLSVQTQQSLDLQQMQIAIDLLMPKICRADLHPRKT